MNNQQFGTTLGQFGHTMITSGSSVTGSWTALQFIGTVMGNLVTYCDRSGAVNVSYPAIDLGGNTIYGYFRSVALNSSNSDGYIVAYNASNPQAFWI